ncbi:hypothetical protein [Aequorivita capsosiphonis]|uniref:hypothetical protein n=1 Tax=Aequorivita capsosiphonis TaxID=487317 RepID=UPI0003F994CD|nr:hypothetical protein [Aequorivita capsosiphonis]
MFNKGHDLFHKVFPIQRLLYKIPAVKRKWEKEGTTPEEFDNKLFKDINGGLNILDAGGIVMMMLASFIYNPIIFVWKCFNPAIYFNVYLLIGSFIVAWIVTDLYISRKKIYLEYFTRYEQWSTTTKRKYIIITTFTFLASIAIFFFVILIKV